MTKVEDIIQVMEDEDLRIIDFIFRRTKPTVQHGGYRYEIMSITNEGGLSIDGIQVWPGYRHEIVTLDVDNSWKESSRRHILNIVKKEIKKLYD